MAALSEAITPTSAFYIRNHFQAPALDPIEYRLRLALNDETTLLDLSLADIRALPHHTITATLECAGNGRSVLNPLPAGVRWGFGAVGTATFTGVPLRELVRRVGLSPDAVELLFDGADSGEARPGETINFARSLPREVALHPDTLLVWDMNGTPLTPDHGYPLRLIVPGWYGVASVKWLREIRALQEPFAGYYQVEQYRYRREVGTPEDTPVTTMRVRALFATPADGAVLTLRSHVVSGAAWSGAGPINRVELSVDEGASWVEAGLRHGASDYAAAGWRALWLPERPGRYTLLARATDDAGNVQPLFPVWNEQGYGNNGVQRISVTIVS